MSFQNGRLPQSALIAVPGGYLEREAGYAYMAEIAEANRRGLPSPASEGDGLYRTIGQQWYRWDLYQNGGNLAAYPGTSVHGLGRAKDNNDGGHYVDDVIGKQFGWFWGAVPSESWHNQYSSGYYHPPPLGPPSLGRPGKAQVYRGPWITSYTKGLIFLGYLTGKPRDFFTVGVEGATKHFQTNHVRFGLKATGVVDNHTLSIYRKAIEWRKANPQ